MLGDFIKLIDTVGLKLAIAIVAAGGTAWYLGWEFLPWVGRRIDSFCTWAHPFATRWCEAKLNQLERSDSPTVRELARNLDPTASNSAELIARNSEETKT